MHSGSSPRNQTLLSLLPNMFNKRAQREHMFGCLPLWLRLCMLMERKAHFTKVCRFPAALGDISGDISRILFQQQGRRRAERDEIFMIIVAKLPTKRRQEARDEELTAALSQRRTRNPNERLVHAALRSPFKSVYNEELTSGARRGALAHMGVTQACRLLPDSSISLSVCLQLSQEAEARHESPINFAYSPRTRAE